MERYVKILGTGAYKPSRTVLSTDIDLKLGLSPGTTAKRSGVSQRSFATTEKATEMAKQAALEAIRNAGIGLHEIDAIVCGQAVPEQLIPSNAALLQRHLGLQDSGIPCFDVNSTCLSFVTALDTISYAICFGRYQRVLIVSSEIASVGLTWKDEEVISLFGDGAGAAIVAPSSALEEGSRILASRMETYSEGANFCEIRGGGTGLFATEFSEANREEFLFHMSGTKVFKLALQLLPAFFERLLHEAEITMSDLKLIVPHQASGSALELMRRKLAIPSEKFVNVLENNGNMVAASIPVALHSAIREGRIERGDKIMLIGTSAGLSVGGMILEY